MTDYRIINVMDVETYVDKNSIIAYCICYIINNEKKKIWLENNNNNIWKVFFESICADNIDEEIIFYTHNINYDGYVLIGYLKETNITFDWFSRDLNLYWIKIWYMKNTIIIRCSYKIISLSVAKLGKIINYEKTVFPHKFVNENNLNYVGDIPTAEFFNSIEDYNEFKKQHIFFNLKKIAISYCMKDVEIVHINLIKLIDIIKIYDKNVIQKSYSFSSISYKIFSKKYDKWEINKHNPKIFDYNYIKNSYFGGRCEVFGNPIEKEIIHYFDFTGMYSQCMLQKFPIGKGKISEKNLNINNLGFHTIKFKCNHYLPALPFKSNKLLFPNGIITGTYWYEEIQQAILNNKCEIIDHYSSYEFENEDYIFKDYVEEFINLRKKGSIYNVFGKNMINGLYGSFALVEENFFTLIILNEIEFNSIIELTTVLKWRKLGKIYVIDIKKDNKSSIYFDKRKKWTNVCKRNISYAAIISSKARIKLNTALMNVLEDGGKLYYTDTDSIFAGYTVNKLNQILGEIKWSEIYEDAIFISSKFYFLKNKKLKLKGIKTSSYEFDEIKEKFYKNKLFLSFDNQISFHKKNYDLLFNNATKLINLNIYDKRIFIKNKTKTIPQTLNYQTIEY
jgi:hypothetical protein